MKKWVAVLCVALVVACSIIPAFAVGESGDPYTVGDDVTPVAEELEPAVMNLDGATVNVSDESIQAIADAVNSSNFKYAYQYTLVGVDGNSIVVDTNIGNLLNDYYVYFGYTSSVGYESSTLIVSAEEIPIYSWYGTYQTEGAYGYQMSDGVISFDTLSTDYSVTFFKTICWTNVDVVDSKTSELIFAASYSPVRSWEISFDTGFDDLIINSQSSLNLVLPEPTRFGYIFLGWYLDPECTEVYSSSYEFTQDTTLYAKWSEEPPMAFFAGVLFDSLTVILESPPILYLVSLMGLVLIIGIGKVFVSSRI